MRLLVRWGPPALLTIAAVPVSLYKLGSAPMWNDETASVSISVQHGHAFWSAVASDGGSMSAYYILLHTLFLAGLAESPVSVRLVSVVAFVATMPFLYGLVLRCFGAPIAALATALVVTNRTVIAKAQEARGYTLGLFLVVVATWFLTSGVARSSRLRFAAWGVTFAVACYSLLLTPLFAASQVLSLGTLRRRSALMRWAAMAIVLVGVLLVPLVLLALHRGTAQIDWIPAIGSKTVDAELVGLLSSRFPIWLRWPMFVAIALGAWKIVCEARSRAPGSTERWERVLLLCWATLPLAAVLLISFEVSLLQAGYLIAAIPSYSILAAVGITTAVELVVAGVSKLRARAGSRRLIAPNWQVRALQMSLAASTAVLFVLVPYFHSWDAYATTVENGPRATAFVVDLARPGDGVIFDQPSQRMIFDYYLLRDFDKAGVLPRLPVAIWPSSPWGTERPYAADHSLPSASELAAAAGTYRRVWVVDGGWAPLRKYLASNRVMLAHLADAYHVAGEISFKGVKVFLFERSGSLPVGMQRWYGPA